MKKVIYQRISAFIVSMSFMVFASARDLEKEINSIFTPYPRVETYELSNGRTISLPVHYYQIEGLVVMGRIQLKQAQNLLKGTGLFPAAVTPSHGLAVVYMVNHPRNSIGTYQEFVVLVAATPNPKLANSRFSNRNILRRHLVRSLLYTSKDRRARSNQDFMFYVPWIHVSTEDALLAGREIWYLQKDLAQFQFDFAGPQKSASMKSESCHLDLGFPYRHFSVTLPLYMDFNLVGTWKQTPGQIVKAPMFAKGDMQVSIFNTRRGEYFRADKTTPCGKWFSQAGFRPLLWQYVARSGAILFQPTDQAHIAQPDSFKAEVLTESADSELTKLLMDVFQPTSR